MRTGILCARNESMHDTRRDNASEARTRDAVCCTQTPSSTRVLPAVPSGRAEVIYPSSDPSAGPFGPEGLTASASGTRTFARKGVTIKRVRSY